MVRMWTWLLGTLCLVSWAGCSGGSGGQATVPVKGTVKLKGQPLAGAQVSFMAKQGAARAATGTTDAQGNYELTTFNPKDGAVVGEHTVTVTKASASAGGASPSAMNQGADYMAMMKNVGKAPPKSQKDEPEGIPAKYADPKNSGLEAKVTKEGPNKFDFDLQ